MTESEFRRDLAKELCRLGFNLNIALELSNGNVGVLSAIFEGEPHERVRLAKVAWDYIRLLPDEFFVGDRDPIELWNYVISETKITLPV